MIVLERRLDVVEEKIDWCNVANAMELVKDSKNCWAIYSQSANLPKDLLAYSR
jgi:hypothetical protein